MSENKQFGESLEDQVMDEPEKNWYGQADAEKDAEESADNAEESDESVEESEESDEEE